MIKTHMIKILVDEEQYLSIKRNAQDRGHSSVSSFLRDLALNRYNLTEKLISEIHTEVVMNGRSKA